MNKTELVAAIAAETGLTKKDTEATINAFTAVVEKELPPAPPLLPFSTALTALLNRSGAASQPRRKALLNRCEAAML